MKYQILLSGYKNKYFLGIRIRKHVINLSSAEFAQRVVMVKAQSKIVADNILLNIKSGFLGKISSICHLLNLPREHNTYLLMFYRSVICIFM